jgi:hypothetical protein
MPEHKPHHQLVLWAAEHAPESNRNLAVDVCPEAFDKLLREGMRQWPYDPESQLVRHRQGEIPLGRGKYVLVRDWAEGAETVLFWEGRPFYTLQLTAHQKLAWMAAFIRAKTEQIPSDSGPSTDQPAS